MKKKIAMALIFLIMPVLIFAQSNKLGAWDPDGKNPFMIPAKLKSIITDYRKNWIRLTQMEFSGLHWNQGIVVYINKNHKVFATNYIGFLTITEGLDEDEDCDPGEKYVEDADECVSIFEPYPVGTMVLKENYILKDNIPQKAKSVTLMIKHEKSYDPEGGGWEFIQFDTAGKILIQGNNKDPSTVAACSSCHKNMIDRDFIFSTFYRSQKALGKLP